MDKKIIEQRVWKENVLLASYPRDTIEAGYLFLLENVFKPKNMWNQSRSMEDISIISTALDAWGEAVPGKNQKQSDRWQSLIANIAAAITS
jgi:hypothetical protein